MHRRNRYRVWVFLRQNTTDRLECTRVKHEDERLVKHAREFVYTVRNINEYCVTSVQFETRFNGIINMCLIYKKIF